MFTFVLVPGAWQGGWAWQPVARRLRAAGHHAVTVTFPGLADGDDRAGLRLTDAIDHLAAAVERPDLRDVVLVAHSWGGYPVTAAAHRIASRLRRVIFYNGMVPRPGTPVTGENADSAAMITAAIASTPDGAIPAEPAFLPLLLPDSGAELRGLFLDLMTPMPGAYFTEAIDTPGVDALGIPVDYLLSDDDRVLIRPGAEFAARIGRTPVAAGRGHQSMLTHPDEATAALLAAAG